MCSPPAFFKNIDEPMTCFQPDHPPIAILGITSKGELLAIVPGKRMVSLLSGWSQSKYGPSFNGLRIASNLQSGEIHPEVRAVIEAIEEHDDLETP